jgi:hypothetical protein
MGLKSFKEFNNSIIKEAEYSYHRDYTPYNRGKSGFSRWMSGMGDRLLSGGDTLKSLRDSNDKLADHKMATQSISDFFGFASKAISKIADWVTPDGDSQYEYRNRGRKKFEDDLEKRREDLIRKWEKENMDNKEVTKKDAEEFYASGILAGRDKFGKGFDLENPKDEEEELYSSYMSDIMHKYYQKIKTNAK